MFIKNEFNKLEIMKNKLLIIFSIFFLIDAKIQENHKQEVHNWYNKQKLTQVEKSLLAQRLYYLFEFYNNIFITTDKLRLQQITKTLKEIDIKNKKFENASKAFNQILQRINDFKVKGKKIKINQTVQNTILNFFSYLNVLYNEIYKDLKDKKITFGPDKNKMLPKELNVPNQQNIQNTLNKINLKHTKKLKELTKTKKKITKTKKLLILKPKIIKESSKIKHGITTKITPITKPGRPTISTPVTPINKPTIQVPTTLPITTPVTTNKPVNIPGVSVTVPTIPTPTSTTTKPTPVTIPITPTTPTIPTPIITSQQNLQNININTPVVFAIYGAFNDLTDSINEQINSTSFFLPDITVGDESFQPDPAPGFTKKLAYLPTLQTPLTFIADGASLNITSPVAYAFYGAFNDVTQIINNNLNKTVVLDQLLTDPTPGLNKQLVYLPINSNELQVIKKIEESQLDVCTFAKSFNNLPSFDENIIIPTDVDSFNQFVSSFNDSVKNYNSIVSSFSSQLTDWKNNSDYPTFINLLKDMSDKTTNYNNFKGNYNDCVTNAPQSDDPQSGCSPELFNYIDALNQIYDSYVAILEFLDKYGLSPIAIPVARLQKAAVISPSQQNSKSLSIDDQDISINTIVGFDQKAFNSKINEFISKKINPCNDYIKKISDSISAQNIIIQDIIDKINDAKNNLQQKNPNSTLSTPAIIETSAGIALTLKLDPEIVVVQAVMSLISKSDKDEEFFAILAGQLNKNLINDFSFSDVQGSVSNQAKWVTLDLIEGIANTIGLLIVSQFAFAEDMVNAVFDPIDALTGLDL